MVCQRTPYPFSPIIGIVDVFDALTTNRPYRKALPTESAYSIMLADAESGLCSPDLVATFVALHRERGWDDVSRASALVSF